MKPTKKTKLQDLWAGMRRNPWRTVVVAFAAFSVFWTLTEAINHFLPGVKIEGGYALTIIIIASILYSLNRIWKPSRVSIKVATTNTVLDVIFGDLFAQEGLKAIAVTEFFESELGLPVSDKSLHGVFLKKYFGGGVQAFDKQVNEQLKGIQNTSVTKAEGKSKSFPIGTTALIQVDGKPFIVFALAKAEHDTCKAFSDVTMMWSAMHKLWERARVESGGHPLNLPLIGSGLSGIGLPTRDLLNLIILSAITETKARQITQRIRIILHPDRFEEIDLRDVKQHWEDN